jgi:micrococcal nuclease
MKMMKSLSQGLFVLLLLLPTILSAQDFYLCTRVVDGDTIIVKMKGTEERVRLIGMDTPETVHPEKPIEYFGKAASAFTKRMAEGKMVRLEYDWQEKDKYGRLLAYVYLEDGIFLNAEIINQGYGFAYTRFPF